MDHKNKNINHIAGHHFHEMSLTQAHICTAIKHGLHPQPPVPGLFDPTSVIALFMFEPDVQLLFIQKADIKAYTWANQMAFPGGHRDRTDRSSKHTALRELNEEMGIDSSNVEVIGSMGHFQTLNNKDIEAWAGVWNQKDSLEIDQTEIKQVYKIPVKTLIQTHMDEGFHLKEVNFMRLVYPYQGVRIWGVTAKIVCHMLNLILGCQIGP